MLYRFDCEHAGTLADVASLVGGKGASLWTMTRELGLSTPPGFTIGCDYNAVYDHEGLTAEILAAIDLELESLHHTLGRGFGNPADPLLVAVRSGAAVSMPGMMETILNVGLTPETVEGLAVQSGNRAFALDSYRRFLEMFARAVLGQEVPHRSVDLADVDALQAATDEVYAQVAAAVGEAVLGDAKTLLHMAIGAVFKSRDSETARAYRQREGLPEDMGTAVTVQAMVFGNFDARSGTGVLFSRNPSTGEPELTGDWMAQAQGEDVVAGVAATRPIHELADVIPAAYEELAQVSRLLEHHYQDMVDVEFTVERGRLWVLQARVGKRSPAAGLRIAVELAEDADFDVDRAQALARVDPELLSGKRSLAEQVIDGKAIATGLPASPGTATGAVVLSSESAVEAVEADEQAELVLVRRETSPADVHGMSVARGVLTTLGGLMSHAAVVARGWGLPAVVGAETIELDEAGFTVGGVRVEAGERISIDGASGVVYLGDITSGREHDPFLETLRAWARELDTAAGGAVSESNSNSGGRQ